MPLYLKQCKAVKAFFSTLDNEFAGWGQSSNPPILPLHPSCWWRNCLPIPWDIGQTFCHCGQNVNLPSSPIIFIGCTCGGQCAPLAEPWSGWHRTSSLPALWLSCAQRRQKGGNNHIAPMDQSSARQGGRSWQSFGMCKNDQNFRQACICYFCGK